VLLDLVLFCAFADRTEEWFYQPIPAEENETGQDQPAPARVVAEPSPGSLRMPMSAIRPATAESGMRAAD
jgi:hypothetical protein